MTMNSNKILGGLCLSFAMVSFVAPITALAETTAQSVKESAKETGRDISKGAKKGARSLEDKTCSMVNGKMQCAAKKVGHKMENAKDEIKDKADDVK